MQTTQTSNVLVQVYVTQTIATPVFINLTKSFTAMQTTQQQIKPGDRVTYAPKHPSMAWAEGERTVKRIENGKYILECGDIRLEASRDEVKPLFK